MQRTSLFAKPTKRFAIVALLVALLPQIALGASAQAAGSAWVQQISSNTLWFTGVASSSDGTKLVATAVVDGAGDYIYTSADSGATWVSRTSAGARGWTAVASSSDGTKLVATSDYIYTSTDSGVTWNQQAGTGPADWYAVASSSDGSKLVAVTYGNYISTSTDSGATWTQRTSAGKRNWFSVASSGDGSKLFAVTDGSDNLYASTDSGATWVAQGSKGLWAGVATSDDGTKVVSTLDAYVYTSTNSGVTWVKHDTAGYLGWVAVASSSDGTKLAAATGTTIKTSNDSGATWTTQNVTGNVWVAMASSGDGSKIAAVTSLGSLYTYIAPSTLASPAVSASTPAVPNTVVGSTSAIQTETITNTGTADLVFGAGAVTKALANSNDFSIVADNCSSHTVAANSTCTVTYSFTPSAVGTRTANLVFASNALSSPKNVVISAAGTAPAISKVVITKVDKTTFTIKGGTTIVITGSAFNALATVKIAGIKATITKRSSSTKITLKTPAHKAGKVALVVTNPDGGSASVNVTYKK